MLVQLLSHALFAHSRELWSWESIHSHHSLPDVNLPLYVYILERLLSKPVLAQRLAATRNGTRGRTCRKDAVDARLAHFVVAFWVYQEAHVRIEVAGGFADGADFYIGRTGSVKCVPKEATDQKSTKRVNLPSSASP